MPVRFDEAEERRRSGRGWRRPGRIIPALGKSAAGRCVPAGAQERHRRLLPRDRPRAVSDHQPSRADRPWCRHREPLTGQLSLRSWQIPGVTWPTTSCAGCGPLPGEIGVGRHARICPERIDRPYAAPDLSDAPAPDRAAGRLLDCLPGRYVAVRIGHIGHPSSSRVTGRGHGRFSGSRPGFTGLGAVAATIWGRADGPDEVGGAAPGPGL